jgi:predicted ATPase/DNA-binding winged helix-turn-helix (wHTH) protein
MTTPVAAAPLRFGRFELQSHERRLLIDGEPVALGGRAFDLLQALAERPGRLVGKRALMELVWPGLVVQDNNLAAQMSALRKVVGGDVIATIPGRGYRFVERIEAPAQAASPSATASPESPNAATAVAVAATLRTNLPAELPGLLGRADELAELGALVEAHRLVSIVGAGGIGKSLLTQHLLQARRSAYRQGVCWVELATVEAAALPGAVATALGVHGGRGEPLDALIGALAPLTMLLALDSAEHLLAEVAHLCQVLHDAASGLRIVVTSQAPLKLAAERVFRIGPLAVPDGAMSAAQAHRFGAVALFVERAQSVDWRFALTDANAAAVAEVCRALDGLPLALELAAARAPMLGMQRLLASMQDRLKLLTASRNRAAPARQRTLRAALEWSHGSLDSREQLVFRRLGVVAGSGSLEFIQQVVADAHDGGDLGPWPVLDALDALVDRSLVAVLGAHDDRAPRYRLLESPRAYALERLDATGERAALQRRHALALAAMFDAAYDDYFSDRIGADDWMRRMGADLDNARDALAWARQADNAVVELTIAATMLRALPPSLHVERTALAGACEARLSASVPEPLQLRAWIEISCAWANTQKVRSHHAAERALDLARKVHRPHDDPFTLYHALCLAAGAAAKVAGPQAAAAPLDEMRALEDPAWPAQRLIWGAQAAQFVTHAAGDGAGALIQARRLVEFDLQRGKDASIGLGNLVDAELAAGDAQAAARSGAALVAALQGTRHEFTLALARLNLCAADLALDDCAQAREVAQALWPQAMFFEWPHYAACYLALLAALEARPRTAARLLGFAEAIYAARHEDRGSTNETAATTRARAMAAAALGEAEIARLRAEGSQLREADVAALAFGSGDA